MQYIYIKINLKCKRKWTLLKSLNLGPKLPTSPISLFCCSIACYPILWVYWPVFCRFCWSGSRWGTTKHVYWVWPDHYIIPFTFNRKALRNWATREKTPMKHRTWYLLLPMNSPISRPKVAVSHRPIPNWKAVCWVSRAVLSRSRWTNKDPSFCWDIKVYKTSMTISTILLAIGLEFAKIENI